MRLFHAGLSPLPLPDGHRFPLEKYALLIEKVTRSGLFASEDLQAAPPASDEDLQRVHTMDYIRRVGNGQLSDKELRRIGFPWSPALADRSRRSVGATLAACQAALADGLAANLGGGTHHAYPDHGEGFCVYNDVAVAARAMQASGLTCRVVILDCDVHQGNGTAAIFAGDSSVFTFSIHGARNFPFHKEHSDLDVALPDGCGDTEYLQALYPAAAAAVAEAQADLAIYIAGSDPFRGDRLGRMALTMDGLEQRDRYMLTLCRQASLPAAIVWGGGYAKNVADSTEIYWRTLQLASEIEYETGLGI